MKDLKMISFKASEDFTEELNGFCKEWKITKTALIKMLVYVFIKKISEKQSVMADWIHAYKFYKNQEEE